MQVTVNCPDCSRQLRLPRETLGTTVRCPLCKSVFMTRPVGDGAEAIRVAPKSAASPPPPPRSRPADGPVPLLELDDRPAPAPPPLPKPEKATYDIILDALPPDDPDDRPRRRRSRDDDDREPPRRPARRDPDEDDEERDAAPRQRREGPVFLTFRLFVHDDPNERLNGTFDAEVGPDGLAMWRGGGRVLEVPVGAAVEHSGLGRLRLEIDGRRVEVGVIDPEDQHDELAGELEAFLRKKSDEVTPPSRLVGPVVWVALAPLALPLLALGFGHSIAGGGGMVVWTLLAVALGGICLPIVLKRTWTPEGRAAGALGVSAFGLLVVLIALAFDSGPPPPPLDQMTWRPFAPVESGYRVEMPGHPGPYKTTKHTMPGGVGAVHELELQAYGTWLFVGHGQPGGFDPAGLLDQARRDLTSRSSSTALISESNVTVSGNAAKEVHIRTGDGYDIVARLVAVQGRLIVAMAVTNKLKPGGPEVRKFLDSLALDAKTGWPPRVAGGGPDIKAPDIKPPEGKDDQLAFGGKVVFTPNRPVTWAGFSPDGKTFAALTADGGIVRFSAAGAVLGRRTAQAGDAGPFQQGAVSGDGKTLFVANGRGELHPYDLEQGALGTAQPPKEMPGLPFVALAASRTTLAAGRLGGDVSLWDVKRLTETATIKIGERPLRALAYSEDGSLLAVGDEAGVAHVFDASTRTRKAELRGHRPPQGQQGRVADLSLFALPALAFARDGRTLVTVGNDRTARVWDVPGQKQRHELTHPDAVLAVAFHPAGRLFATGCADGGVRVFEAATGRERGSVRASASGALSGAVRGLSFSADGKQLLVALKNRVELWEVERRVTVSADDRKPLPLLPRHLTRVEAGTNGVFPVGPMAVRPDGSLLAITGRDGKVGTYDPVTLALKHGAVIGATTALALHPREGLVACGVNSNVQLRDTAKDTTRPLTGNVWQPVRALAFSPDGKRLAVGHTGGAIAVSELRVWDVEGSAVVLARSQAGAVSGVAFSPDGVALVTASEGDNVLRLWEVASGRECARLRGHTGPTLCVAYSPDGKWIVSGGKDKTARLWDAARGRVAFALTGHDNAVTAVAFSPDGKTLATGSDDKSVRLWDVPSGKWLHTLAHDGAITGVGFASRGDALMALPEP